MKLTWVALAVSLLGLIFAFTFWCRPIERNWYAHSLVLVKFSWQCATLRVGQKACDLDGQGLLDLLGIEANFHTPLRSII
jgi:hypothetical protein